jgi:hypothetical protein
MTYTQAPFLTQCPLAAPDCYRRQRTVAYGFVRDACCRLEGSDASHKAVLERLRACFAGLGFKALLLPEEDNAEPLRAVGAGPLLRHFETFLQDPAHNGAAAPGRWEPPPPPRGRRFEHQPLLWRLFARRFGTAAEDEQGPVAEALIRELRTFRDTRFMPSLFAKIVNIFQEVHKGGLIPTKQMAPVELPLTWNRAEGEHRPNDQLNNTGMDDEERSFGSVEQDSHERRYGHTLSINFD